MPDHLYLSIILLLYLLSSTTYSQILSSGVDTHNLTCGQSTTHEIALGLLPSLRIVGGFESQNLGAFPWLAGLRFCPVADCRIFCGGTLISNLHILTAAHCIILGPQNTFVTLGLNNQTDFNEPGFQLKTVSSIVKHPNYDENYFQNHDIAVLTLTSQVVLTNYVTPICQR